MQIERASTMMPLGLMQAAGVAGQIKGDEESAKTAKTEKPSGIPKDEDAAVRVKQKDSGAKDADGQKGPYDLGGPQLSALRNGAPQLPVEEENKIGPLGKSTPSGSPGEAGKGQGAVEQAVFNGKLKTY